MLCLCTVPEIDKPLLSYVESHHCYLGCDGKSVFIRTPLGYSVSHPVR